MLQMKDGGNDALENLSGRVIQCRKCPRLVRYLRSICERFPDHWCRPVPGFGDPDATMVIVGLAPGRFGANRTGRMFTGDSSGKFLYDTLYRTGLANQPSSTARGDGLVLKKVYITAALRCAPPQNKPEPLELRRCASYLEEEFAILLQAKVIVALGHIAHLAYLRLLRKGRPFSFRDYPFEHGRIHRIVGDSRILIDSYHPSRQNTQTGKLTRAMFLEIFRKAVRMKTKNPKLKSPGRFANCES